jgi:hypothetical protein
LDLQEPQLQLAKQIANIVDHRLTFLVNVSKVSLYWIKKNYGIDLTFVCCFKFADTYDSAQVLPTPGFYSHPPVVPAPVEPINYSTSETSSSFPLQPEWLAASCPQHVVSPQSNYNNSDGTHQQPQQQDYSSYYWNNWEYSPPFYPTSLTNSTFYSSNTVPDPYSSSYSYYSPETTNPYYYQSCM